MKVKIDCRGSTWYVWTKPLWPRIGKIIGSGSTREEALFAAQEFIDEGKHLEEVLEMKPSQ